MKKNDDFYIGWQDNMPVSRKKHLKKWLWPLVIILPLLAFVVVHFQKDFNSFLFLFGDQSTISGVLHQHPYPVFIADDNQLPEGQSRDVLLVGFGKMGAEVSLQEMKHQHGELDGRHMTLRGTLIMGDGKTLMELTDMKNSLVSIGSPKPKIERPLKRIGQATLKGEVIDPKCYFGVMKPAVGKIHKSCAIRCISGGIPPVLKSHKIAGKSDYYLLLGKNGELINNKVLPLVAEQISLSGDVLEYLSWNVLFVDIDKYLNGR